MYVPILISISFVLSKICPGQASVMKNKRLKGDNSVNIQGRIVDVGFCPSSSTHCLTKLYSIVNSSFKVICRTMYRADGQTDKAATLCFPFLEHTHT